MALPLPRVVSDVGAGGPLVTSMGGMNSLANDMLLRQINQVKAQYAPMTTQAEAASKLAYANLMGPQFMAKLMTNPGFLGNTPNNQLQGIREMITRAGTGQGNASNIFSQMQQGAPTSDAPNSNSLSGWLTDKLKGAFSSTKNALSGVNPDLQKTMAGISHVESGGSQHPYSLIGPDTGGGNRALGKYQVMQSNVPEWTKEALGYSMTPQEFLQSPDAQEKVAAYRMNKHLNEGHSPQDVGSIWLTGKPLDKAGNAHDLYGTTASEYANRMTQGMNDYAQNTGRYEGAVKQESEAGKYRAEDLHDIGKSQLALSNSGAVLDRMTNIVKNPTFQQMRDKIPFFQDKQLGWLKLNGTPEEKKLIGDFTTTAENFIASTVQGFAGKPLVREFDLAQRQKITDKDPVHVAEGKLRASIALKKIAEQKNDIIAGLLRKGIDEAEAVKRANKMVDVSEIERQTEDLLRDKPTDEDIAYMAKKRNMSVDDVRKQLKAKGYL